MKLIIFVYIYNFHLPDNGVIDKDSQDNVKFSLWVSFAEIYNENVYDLLRPLLARQKTGTGQKILLLREDKNGSPYVQGEWIIVFM